MPTTSRSSLKNAILLMAHAATWLVPAVALAWTQDVPFGARVHKHEFSRVSLSRVGCVIKVRLFFDAPDEAYKDPAPSRNYYRFHARIELASQHAVVTHFFHNDAPGARVYEYEQDTTSEGCWAKAETQPRDVKVEGCRGRGCTPEPFR